VRFETLAADHDHLLSPNPQCFDPFRVYLGRLRGIIIRAGHLDDVFSCFLPGKLGGAYTHQRSLISSMAALLLAFS
jgi:hypothetical protein